MKKSIEGGSLIESAGKTEPKRTERVSAEPPTPMLEDVLGQLNKQANILKNCEADRIEREALTQLVQQREELIKVRIKLREDVPGNFLVNIGNSLHGIAGQLGMRRARINELTVYDLCGRIKDNQAISESDKPELLIKITEYFTAHSKANNSLREVKSYLSKVDGQSESPISAELREDIEKNIRQTCTMINQQAYNLVSDIVGSVIRKVEPPILGLLEDEATIYDQDDDLRELDSLLREEEDALRG